MAPPRVPVIDPVEYLVERRFPRYHALLESYVSSSGRGTGLPFEKRQALENQVEAYRQELNGKSKEDLAALFAAAQAEAEEEWRLKAARENQALFYNQPDARADFGHWSSTVFWTLDEGTALVFGRCPRKVNWEKLRIHAASPFTIRYANLRDLVLRARAAGILTDVIPPGAFLAFAQRSGFEPPPELLAAVQAKGSQIADWKTRYEATKADAERFAGETVRLVSEVVQLADARSQLEQQVQELSTKLSDWEFDPESATYPRELDIAMQAWAAVSRSPMPPANPKEALDRWLEAHYPDLPEAARDRLSTTCNWNKLGGRGRPPKNRKG